MASFVAAAHILRQQYVLVGGGRWARRDELRLEASGVVGYRTVRYRFIPYRTSSIPYRTVVVAHFRIVPHRTALFRTIPNCTVQPSTISNTTSPYRHALYRIIPHRTVPYRTVTCTMYFHTETAQQYGAVPHRTVPCSIGVGLKIWRPHRLRTWDP